MKESHTVETAEYAVAQEIYHEPAFNWWVKAVLNKRLSIIPLIKKREIDILRKRTSLGLRSLSHLHRHMR